MNCLCDKVTQYEGGWKKHCSECQRKLEKGDIFHWQLKHSSFDAVEYRLLDGVIAFQFVETGRERN